MKHLALMLLSTLLFAQSAVPITREPMHHLALSNEHVRAFKVEVPPKSQTLIHQHDYDYLFVTIGDSDVTSIRADGTRADLKLPDATVSLSRGGFAHRAINNATTPFRNVTIELLKGAGAAVCGTPDTNPCDLDAIRKTFTATRQEYANVIATVVRLAPGASLPMHTHRSPHLAVMLDNSQILISDANGSQRTLQSKSGDVGWVEAGVRHSIKNSGDKPARILTVEFRNSDSASSRK